MTLIKYKELGKVKVKVKIYMINERNKGLFLHEPPTEQYGL